MSPLAVLSLLAAVSGPPVGAQQVEPVIVRGIVRDDTGKPVPEADVFLLPSLEGGLTDTLGRFRFTAMLRGDARLVIRKIGFMPSSIDITLPLRDSLIITLGAGPVTLTEIVVSAGTYIAGEERGATLTPLEVATTPGTTADIGRTIQTLPGVQTVDEGNAIFVRGGDQFETRVFVNDAVLLQGFRYENPTGSFASTPNAFLLEGIFLSSGGFGARFGNALSGVVSLRTLGRPESTSYSAGASLGGVSLGADRALGPTIGVRGTVARFHTRPIFWINGTPRQYDPAPNGTDGSGSIVWSYRPGGEIKLFALTQSNRIGVLTSRPDFEGTYRVRTRSSSGILSWRDGSGIWSQTASIAVGERRQGEDYGAFVLQNDTDVANAFTYAGFELSDRLILRAGGEWERLAGRFVGSVPTSGDDAAPGARVTIADSRATGNRVGAFAEADLRLHPRIRVTPGLRTDRSTLAGVRTWDPRLAAAWLLGTEATLTFAWGVYHQVPEPLYYDNTLGAPGLPPMRASQVVGGLQLGEEKRILRVEAYAKRYRHLAQFDRDNAVQGGGKGSSHGLDLFLKGDGPLGTTGRVSYSWVRARRTDPHTGIVARAPYDVTHSATFVLERVFGGVWRTGLAGRYATGRPYTDVLSATFDPAENRYFPVYAAPYAARVPDLARLDVNASRLVALGDGHLLVLYVSVNNLLDRTNIYEYTWSRDYRDRIEIQSLFNRAFYFGATITLR